MIERASVIGIALCTCLAVPGPGTLAADKALLIGVGTYKDDKVSALPGTQTDVTSVRDMLVKDFSVAENDILELRNEKATRNGILSAIDDWLIDGTQPGDRVFLYYSGHGSYISDVDGDESVARGGDGYDETIVAYDSVCDESNGCINFVLDDDINTKLQQLKDRSVLSIFDSCHSGTMTRAAAFTGSDTRTRLFVPPFDSAQSAQAGQTASSSFTETSTAALVGNRSSLTPQASTRSTAQTHIRESGLVNGIPGHVSLFAVQPFQLALEVRMSNNKPGGLFTQSLVRAVRTRSADTNNDSQISFGELHHSVAQFSQAFCTKSPRKCGNGVNPMLETSGELIGMDIFAFGKSGVHEGGAEQETISEQQVSSILTQGNDANLSIIFEPSNRLNVSELMRLTISSEREGQLLLFDRNAAGELAIIYPNEYDNSDRPDGKPLGWMRAKGEVIVPDSLSDWAFVIEPPYGEGHIIAILVEHERAATFNHRAFVPVARPTEALGELRLSIEQLIDDLDDDLLGSSPQWSIAMAPYEVKQGQ